MKANVFLLGLCKYRDMCMPVPSFLQHANASWTMLGRALQGPRPSNILENPNRELGHMS